VLAGDIALAQSETKTDKAIKYYQQALKLNDYNAKAANRLGMQMRNSGEFKQAETLYTQAINAQPSQPESYRNRGVLYDLYMNEKSKALQDYEYYLALLNHALLEQTSGSSAFVNKLNPQEAYSFKRLSEEELKGLKTDIKLAKRWLLDVGRQVSALEKSRGNTATGGQ
jgi:tetratricopeptide (TPR) repeat protein